MQSELIRKTIHLVTAVIPLMYLFYLDREQMSVFCISLFILFLLGDTLRIYVTHLTQIYEKIFGKLLRSAEKGKKLNGATLLLLGFSVATILFEKEIAILAMLILAVSDSLAAIIGMKFGRREWFGKTMEGSLAFFITTFFITGFFSDNIGIITSGAALITGVELFSGKLNDNLTIPVISGLFFTVASDYLAGNFYV